MTIAGVLHEVKDKGANNLDSVKLRIGNQLGIFVDEKLEGAEGTTRNLGVRSVVLCYGKYQNTHMIRSFDLCTLPLSSKSLPFIHFRFVYFPCLIIS